MTAADIITPILPLLASLLTAFVALLHLGFFVLESP
jgi:sorbitol-specific phosphotransferase system component IIC